MRHAAVFAFAAVFAIQVGFFLYGRQRDSGNKVKVGPTSDLCWHQEISADAPISIDDKAVLQRLAKQGGWLVEQGKTIEMQALIKQLNLDRCDIDLAQAEASFDDRSQLFAHAKDSIVVVASIYKCNKCDNWHATSATGFVISSSGAVVTNHHVVNVPDKKGLVVMTADGHVVPVRRVLAASRSNDLAILGVDAKDLTPLPIASKAASMGSEISVISHPARRFYCFTNGVVSRYMKMKSGNQVVDGMSITADYARGSSGAPVLNKQGQVVGIVKSTDSVYYSVENGQQKNLQMVFKTCIPSTSLLDLIAQHKNVGE